MANKLGSKERRFGNKDRRDDALRRRIDSPKFFDTDSWPPVRRDQIAAMMPFAREFDEVYASIKEVCLNLGYPAIRVD